MLSKLKALLFPKHSNPDEMALSEMQEILMALRKHLRSLKAEETVYAVLNAGLQYMLANHASSAGDLSRDFSRKELVIWEAVDGIGKDVETQQQVVAGIEALMESMVREILGYCSFTGRVMGVVRDIKAAKAFLHQLQDAVKDEIPCEVEQETSTEIRCRFTLVYDVATGKERRMVIGFVTDNVPVVKYSWGTGND